MYVDWNTRNILSEKMIIIILFVLLKASLEAICCVLEQDTLNFT